MNRLRVLLTVLTGFALMLGLVAPAAQASEKKVWVALVG